MNSNVETPGEGKGFRAQHLCALGQEGIRGCDWGVTGSEGHAVRLGLWSGQCLPLEGAAFPEPMTTTILGVQRGQTYPQWVFPLAVLPVVP